MSARWRADSGRDRNEEVAADPGTQRVDALEELGVLEDTLVLYIIGDNGASAEGGLNGAFMITTASNGGAEYETPEFWTEHLDELGGPHAYNHYAVGWAHALCTPYQWTKQVASHYGGTRRWQSMKTQELFWKQVRPMLDEAQEKASKKTAIAAA